MGEWCPKNRKSEFLLFIGWIPGFYGLHNYLFQRVLALIYLAHASDVLENAFAPLSDEDYDVAMKRVRYLLGKTFYS